MAKDRTATPFESVKHAHRHGHPEPVPHLRAADGQGPADDHGPEVSHDHVHTRGGPHDPYDHDGHDHERFHADSDTPAADLKFGPGAADDNNS